MSKSRFRIIAIRPITPLGRDEKTIAKVNSIQKKVFGAEWMYFYGGYHLTDIPDGTSDEFALQPLYGYFLEVPKDADKDGMLYDTDSLAVNISAIVGPNGSGKSSAVELMIRILNNLSVAAKGETYNHKSSEHLFFIEDVYGSLLAIEGDKYFQIQVLGRSVKIATYNWDVDNRCYVCGQFLELLDPEGQDDRYKPINGSGLGKLQLYNLFYTAIFNYSMYAYNYKDYYEERTIEDRWRKRKKNDNAEISYKGKYTQDRNWLKGLFHKNDGYQTPIVLNPMRDNGIINVPKENKLASERLHNMLFYTNEHQQGRGSQPMFPFRTINEHLEVVAIKITEKEEPYFSRERLFRTLNYRENSLTKHFDDVRKTICTTWSRLFCMGYHEDTPHEKLAWDYVVYKTLKIAKTYDKYDKLEQALVYFKIFNPIKIETLLSEMLLDETHITLKLRQALCFLKFKVFREDYREVIPLYEVYEKYAALLKLFRDMKISMNQTTGQLTMNVPKGYTANDLPSFTFDPYTGEVVLRFSNDIERPIPLFYLANGELHVKTPDVMEIMLPPVFDTTLMLVEKSNIDKDGRFDDRDLIPMYGLSSGERQISGVVSNFTYHLVNIDSVWNDANDINFGRHPEDKTERKLHDNGEIIKYKYINAVFDEVELYFHPDLQRRFVKYLLDALRSIHLEHIQGINMMLVTHSTFVLSDIPSTNLLCLTREWEGKPFGNTYAANIHDMLNNRFIMPDTIGEFAKENILELVSLYDMQAKEWRACDDECKARTLNDTIKAQLIDKRGKFEYLISIVGDEYLQKELADMLDEMIEFYEI